MDVIADERYSRQADIIPAEKLDEIKPTVIGVGAIGRQVALQLAAIGVSSLQLIDHDTVEESNIASQGFYETDMSCWKVDAVKHTCTSINCLLQVEAKHERFKRSHTVGNIVFCCVDDIQTRKMVNDVVHADLFIDGRMSAEVLRVLTVWDFKTNDYYKGTLFTSEEAYAGSCTAKTTIYCANIAAALMVSQLTKWLRRIPLERDFTLNILTNELTLGNPEG